MGTYKNEIEEFIYRFCYQKIMESAKTYIYSHPALLNLSTARIKYPDRAILESMIPEFVTNIRIDEDTLSFDIVSNCIINLIQDDFDRPAQHDVTQWLSVSCEAVIKEKLESVIVTEVSPYKEARKKKKKQEVSANIVPIIHKDELDEEATAFLQKYYPVALESPMPVPLDQIAADMGLDVVKGHCIEEEFNIFGEICFSAGTVEVFDLFKCSKSKIDVKRGTILIDAYTFFARNLGCVNNTIAHELYHWHRHRMYASIKQLLHNEKLIACRCPSDIKYPSENTEWTDEQRMEWQANNVAPRILMPIETFVPKTKELYKQYNYDDTPLKLAVLTCIADDLAALYKVSRQSALIRMTETGFPEAKMVLNQLENKYAPNVISIQEAFLEYSENESFRQLIDSGSFVYVNGYYVINDVKYIDIDDSGAFQLSDYAWEHLEECTLHLTLKPPRNPKSAFFSGIIMHRSGGADKVPQYSKDENNSVINLAGSVAERNRIFQWQQEAYKLTSEDKSFGEMVKDIVNAKGWNKIHFEEATKLGQEVYSKILNDKWNNPEVRSVVAFACGYKLNIATVNRLLQSISRGFNNSEEHRTYQFCISSMTDKSIDEINELLEMNHIEPLGTKQRL